MASPVAEPFNMPQQLCPIQSKGPKGEFEPGVFAAAVLSHGVQTRVLEGALTYWTSEIVVALCLSRCTEMTCSQTQWHSKRSGIHSNTNLFVAQAATVQQWPDILHVSTKTESQNKKSAGPTSTTD